MGTRGRKGFRPALREVFSEAQRAYYEDPGAVDASGTVAQAVAAGPGGNRGRSGLARLLEIAGGQRAAVAASCALAVAASLVRIVPYLATYAFASELVACWWDTRAMDARLVAGCAAATLAAAVAGGALSYASASLAHRAAFQILLEVRMALMEKLARIPSSWFSRTRQGELKKVVVDDVERAEGFIAHSLPDAVTAVATPLVAVAAMLLVDWRLALLLAVPVVLSFALLGAALGRPEGTACQVAMARSAEAFSGTAVEYAHGMPVVKVFNRSLSAFGRFERDAREFAGNVRWATEFNARGMGLMYAVIGTQMLLIVPALVALAAAGEPAGSLLSKALLFALVGGGMKEPVLQMVVKAVDLNSINASVARVDEVLAAPEVEEPADPRVPASHDVRFEGVSFSYDGADRPAVDRVTADFPQGTVTGIVGPSGGGKSTLAELALRLVDPQEGRVLIGGVDVRDIASDELYRACSFVFQESFILSATVEENIRMGGSATHDEVVAAAKAAQVHDVIEALPRGYETVIGEGGASLSGGERQRVAIARVMLRDAPIVVLDEATAYADAESEARIQEAIARLARGKTVIVVAHRLKTVRRADQLIVMDGGRVRGRGSHEELMLTCPLYREMVEADERRGRWSVGGRPQAAGRGRTNG